MSTCFIFIQNLDAEELPCLRLDQNGEIEAPLALCAISELSVRQQNARTIIVLPTETSSLYDVELPWLGERKSRAAIPYALEEQVAQSVNILNFAFNRDYYNNDRYLVVVTDKQFLVNLMARLDSLNLQFHLITLDWFALQENEVCVAEKSLIVHDKIFNGALSGELATLYLENKERKGQLLLFQDSMPLSSKQKKEATFIDDFSLVWIAKRLLKAKKMDLCQGELQHGMREHVSMYWYRICALIMVLIIAIGLCFKAIYLYSINTHIKELDNKIAVIYQKFFPEAKQVVSPKFRIEQLLKANNAPETSPLWTLLDTFGQAFKEGQFSIDQYRFQAKVLTVTLSSNDFAALENLQARLKKNNIKVSQVQASSQKDKVVATLELSL